jgi:methylmalonyl-CoA mutase
MGLSGKDQWINAAKAELDGADPFHKLVSHKGSIRVEPYYTASDTKPELQYALRASNAWWGARQWNNAPLVRVANAEDGNKLALNYLATGADGILFQLLHPIDDVEQLLADIKLAYCSVFFTGEITKEFVENLFDYARQSGQASMSGGLYYNSAGEIIPTEHSFTSFRSSGVCFETADVSIELSLAQILNEFVKHFCTCSFVPRAFDNASVFINSSNDFFLEIARLKSLRILWNGLCKGFGVDDKTLFVHSRTNAWVAESFQPHGNMIAATSRSLSSILGGCDALTVDAENAEDSTTNRIARNISLVMREESHISKVADATSGSYYIDSLVEQICEAAWTEFQKLSK